MKQAHPAMYAGVGRGERRRIARELLQLRERHQGAVMDAERIRALVRKEAQAKHVSAIFMEDSTPDPRHLLAREIEVTTAKVPLQLLACGDCHRPTPLCTCGLDWNVAS